jgi:hypothetical protein
MRRGARGVWLTRRRVQFQQASTARSCLVALSQPCLQPGLRAGADEHGLRTAQRERTDLRRRQPGLGGVERWPGEGESFGSRAERAGATPCSGCHPTQARRKWTEPSEVLG